MKVLFVCSQARMRSYTARNLALLGGVDAECCGSDSSSRLPINNQLLQDADVIFCMEPKHRNIVKSMIGSEGKPVLCLGIEDVYNAFDSALANELESVVYLLGYPALSKAIGQGYKTYKIQDLAHDLEMCT